MAMCDVNHSFTQNFHKKPYAYISPKRPELSQKGRIVIITGGSDGCGYAITRAFATAGAAHLVITARRQGPLDETKEKIEADFPGTKVHAFAADLLDASSASKIVEQTRSVAGEPDVLVTCASFLNTLAPVLQVPPEDLANAFQANITGNMAWVTAFLGPGGSKLSKEKPKIIVNVSTLAATFANPGMSAYGASKEAFVHLLSHVQQDYGDKGVRVTNMNPGIMYTRFITERGFTEDFHDWDDVDTAGHTAVWLASPEADFLAGKFVYAPWDMEELVRRKDELTKPFEYALQIGLVGEPVPRGKETRVNAGPRKGPLYGPFKEV